jgi:hypothetical protein
MPHNQVELMKQNDGRIYLELASGGGVLIRDVAPLTANSSLASGLNGLGEAVQRVPLRLEL